MSSKKTCFISYTWHSWQKDFAQIFAEEIRKEPDFGVWIDTEQVLPGHSLNSRLEEGIRRESDCAICLVSPEYLRSENCRKELYAAQSSWFQHGKPLVAVKIGACDLPFELRDLVYDDLSGLVTSNGQVDHAALAAGVTALTRRLRHLLEPKVDLLKFFDPGSRTTVRLVTNRSYVSPFREKNFSTTTRFTNAVAELLRTLTKRTVISGWSVVHPDYVESVDLDALVAGNDSLISYASSKINPLTNKMLMRLETVYDIRLRFVFQDDVSSGKSESEFPDFDTKRRVALVLKDSTLAYGNGRDYGLLLRAVAPQETSGTWWIAAGCGRAGSSAIYLALFDPSWHDVLWPRLLQKLPSSFFAVVGVRYNSAHSDAPTDPEVVDFRVLS
jgi:TIR domain